MMMLEEEQGPVSFLRLSLAVDSPAGMRGSGQGRIQDPGSPLSREQQFTELGSL